MSSTTFPPIPVDTTRAAQAVFGSSNYYLVIGERADALFDGLCLESPSSSPQKPVYKLAILYLITIFQHLETLPDQQAVDALHERVDWKYALHLPLKPTPWKSTSLCEFRTKVLVDHASEQNLQLILKRLTEIPQTALCQCLHQDPGKVLSHVCRISRLEKIWEAINQALESLAIRDPDWLRRNSLPHWYERYGHGRTNLRLRSNQHEQEAFAQGVGGDGYYLLNAISGSEAQEMSDLPEIIALQTVWNEQFEREPGKVNWRKEACAGCSIFSRIRATALEVSPIQKE